ncbi:MAG: hypothetical protein LBR17_08880 [Bacteroidales bacterium]|jgi:hypothetical protein|nr:hypothetical protein [Bacteroidales bacterium]
MNNKTNTGAYDNLTAKLSKTFALELETMESVYNFDIGNEFEIAICHILRRFLPTKYGITRGFVVAFDGQKEGDDIIIYNQEQFPTLRFLDKEDYSRKEQIPIEAVYAYIEAKHTLDKQTLEKSLTQIKKVKELCWKRNDINGQQVFQNLNGGTRPCVRNPLYGMILTANSVNTNNQKTEDSNEIQDFLMNQFTNKTISNLLHQKPLHSNPDCIVAGKSNFVVAAEQTNEISDGPNILEITPFYSGTDKTQYQVNVHQNMAFGLGLAHLMIALNQIELKASDMPWIKIFNITKMPNNDERAFVENALTNKK